MPLVPNLLEKFMFFTANMGPGPVLDMWSGPAFRFVLAALRLGVFETLQSGPLTSQQLAQKLAVDAQGLDILLHTLQALGYVRQSGGAFRNTAMTQKWLLEGGAINFASYYLFWGAIMEQFMPRLEESLRSGRPPVHLYEWIEDQPEVSRYFQEGMIALARYVADDVAKAMPPLSGARRVLDIGGGHATYSIALCRRSPQLSAVIYDSPQALVTGRENARQAGLEGRIEFLEGDFMTDDMPTGFDVALLFNIVHGLSPEGNLELFRRVRRTLRPGGKVVILEQIHGTSPLPLTSAVAHILSMTFYHLLGGRVYTEADIRGWLHAAGYTDFRRGNILRASSALISGTAAQSASQ